MSVVLDTSVLIDILRGFQPALAYAEKLNETPICSEVTRVEILRGLRNVERQPTERLFASLEWISVDETIARRAGEMGRTWRRSHQGIGTADLIVAATSEELDVQLSTLNVKHFPMFKGLRPPYRT